MKLAERRSGSLVVEPPPSARRTDLDSNDSTTVDVDSKDLSKFITKRLVEVEFGLQRVEEDLNFIKTQQGEYANQMSQKHELALSKLEAQFTSGMSKLRQEFKQFTDIQEFKANLWRQEFSALQAKEGTYPRTLAESELAVRLQIVEEKIGDILSEGPDFKDMCDQLNQLSHQEPHDSVVGKASNVTIRSSVERQTMDVRDGVSQSFFSEASRVDAERSSGNAGHHINDQVMHCSSACKPPSSLARNVTKESQSTTITEQSTADTKQLSGRGSEDQAAPMHLLYELFNTPANEVVLI